NRRFQRFGRNAGGLTGPPYSIGRNRFLMNACMSPIASPETPPFDLPSFPLEYPAVKANDVEPRVGTRPGAMGPRAGAAAGARPIAPYRAPITPAARDALYRDFQPLVRRLIRQYGEDPELRQDLEG